MNWSLNERAFPVRARRFVHQQHDEEMINLLSCDVASATKR